jgi:hypothetical protein
VLLPKKINTKSAAKLSIIGIMPTPWGASRARDWRGSQIHHESNANRKAVSRSACADLLLEFAAQTPRLYLRLVSRSKSASGFTTGTPDTPEFFAEQKMRPNDVLKKQSISVNSLQTEALYPQN